MKGLFLGGQFQECSLLFAVAAKGEAWRETREEKSIFGYRISLKRDLFCVCKKWVDISEEKSSKR